MIKINETIGAMAQRYGVSFARMNNLVKELNQELEDKIEFQMDMMTRDDLDSLLDAIHAFCVERQLTPRELFCLKQIMMLHTGYEIRKNEEELEEPGQKKEDEPVNYYYYFCTFQMIRISTGQKIYPPIGMPRHHYILGTDAYEDDVVVSKRVEQNLSEGYSEGVDIYAFRCSPYNTYKEAKEAEELFMRANRENIKQADERK